MRSGKDALALTAARRLPDFAGVYQGGIDKIVAGGGLKLVGQGGSAMIEVGIAELMAQAAETYVVPTLTKMVGGQIVSAGQTITKSGQSIVNSSAMVA